MMFFFTLGRLFLTRPHNAHADLILLSLFLVFSPLRWMGKGVTKAVENVNTIIAPALLGKDPTDQKAIDDLMIELENEAEALQGGGTNMMKKGVSMKPQSTTTTSESWLRAQQMIINDYHFIPVLQGIITKYDNQMSDEDDEVSKELYRNSRSVLK